MIDGVEIGTAYPNTVSFKMLQEMTSLDSISTEFTVESISDHAKSQFETFAGQAARYGLPPTFQFLPVSEPLTLVENATCDQGIVAQIPVEQNATLSIAIPTLHDCGGNSEIQIDIARRDSCFLPSIPSGESKICAQPRELEVHLEIGGQSSIPKGLKSRFNVEFGPYGVCSPSNSSSTVTLLICSSFLHPLLAMSRLFLLSGKPLKYLAPRTCQNRSWM